MQGKFALVHLQSLRRALLQPHLMSSLLPFDASGRVRDGPLERWWEGLREKKQKKNSCKGNDMKKISAKKKVKKKIHAEGRFNCDLYLTYKICQCL